MGTGFQWVFWGLVVQISTVAGGYFEPFNVSYDSRALVIDGNRRMLISAGIHYPRATPEMWPDLISKSKEGGVDVIETYVFWNGHEPLKGQYNFEGRYDIVKFVKQVGSSGLYLFLRIGPYVCAEWNFGGFPVWLRDIPGIEFRTDNIPFKEEMQRFVKRIVDLMREESLFSWQGGPIIMLQIENEYGNLESSYGPKGKDYMTWAAKMAVGLDAGVPWVMCKQVDAPEYIIDTCNGYYCDGFKPNSKKKPTFWTENWVGWYTSWGDRLPHRPVEDVAFAVARFFQRGGSFQNYYMYFGGTNFGRTAGGPNYITSYDYDAPLDEYGLLSQPKWGHLKDLHAVLKLCEPALVAIHSPQYIKLGPKQEAHIYRDNGQRHGKQSTFYGPKCSAFLANIDEHSSVTVKFLNENYTLPPWSVSILPDCRNIAFNTAKVGAQTSIKTVGFDVNPDLIDIVPLTLMTPFHIAYISETWSSINEPIGVWGDRNFTYQGILEHLNVTKDQTDYLWYTTRIYISDEEISFWEENQVTPRLTIDSMRDFVYIFINRKFAASAKGKWIKVDHPVDLVQGYNDITMLSLTVGLQNYGAFLEKDGAGFRGQIKLTGCKNGDLNLTESMWTYQVGLKGEFLKIYASDKNESMEWTELPHDVTPTRFSWYKVKNQINSKFEVKHPFREMLCEHEMRLFTQQNSIFETPLSPLVYQSEDESTDLDIWTLTYNPIICHWRFNQTHFDTPSGVDPVALDLGSMGKGQVWVNGHHIGRYWTLNAPKDGCQTCDYRGAYDSDKCVTNCGEPTQSWYHIPRSWLQASDNLLVIFEETEKNPFKISIKSHFTETICAKISEDHYPPLKVWSHPKISNGTISLHSTVPEMQLKCDSGRKISSIEFASYGTPQGSCQKFSRGDCHAPNSFSVVSQACLGEQSCSIGVSNAVFGGDPCHGVVKTLSVELKCYLTSPIGSALIK